jgi:F-type H+-transporting ATPase subunit b
MNINLTLIGQTIMFLMFVWFCMKFIWPPLVKALDERRAKIADGLAAAERGKHEQELAAKRAADVLKEAKGQAMEILARAEKQGVKLIEEARNDAKSEGERMLVAARAEVGQEVNRAREALRSQVSSLAVAGAGRILGREVDAKAHARMLDDLAAQL